MGHALNKSIKDFIIRSHAMRGYYTPYIPGWDNHGMPIESAIIKQNKLNRKKMPVTEFRSACHEFAQHYVEVQSEGFQRLGVIGDWEHPYLTMNPAFEAEEVKVFGEMYKQGLYLQGPQARLLVPPRRDRSGRGRDRVPGRPLHHGVCEVPPARRPGEAGRV